MLEKLFSGWKPYLTNTDCKNSVLFFVSSGNNGILLPKLFWPTVRKNCSRDQEKFEAEGWELEQLEFKLLKKHSVTKNCSDLSLFE